MISLPACSSHPTLPNALAPLSTSPGPATVSVDRVSEEEWSQLLDQFSDASVYQTWAYGAVSWSEKHLSHLVLQQQGKPIAVAQLRIVSVPLIRRGVAYLLWGPICTRRDRPWERPVFETAARALIEEYVGRRRLMLRIVPQHFEQDAMSESVREVWLRLGLHPEHSSRIYRTFRLNLGSTVELLRKQLDQKWRNQLNAGERNGLTIVEGTSDDLFEQFLELYRDMMARKQFDSAVDPHEFRRIQARLPERQKMVIFICRNAARPLAGLIGSATGETGIYLLGATSRDGLNSKGSYLLQWRMIQWLKERDCRWYDLGGINRDTNPGVYHFKKGLGGQEVSSLQRFSLSAGLLSNAGIKSAEHLRFLFARFRRK